jgi:copper chaperone CopZ
LLLAWLLAMSCPLAAGAAEAQSTVIHVQNMHCANCAQKIARKLYAVAGVKQVTTDWKKGTATIQGQAGKALSPRGLWEAVEKANFKVVKLTGPAGEFQSKPKS